MARDSTLASSSALSPSLSQPLLYPTNSHSSAFLAASSSALSNNPFIRTFTDSEPTSTHRPATQRGVQPGTIPVDPVFNQWPGTTSYAGVSSFPTATVNQRRMAAAERHQPAPRGLPVPTRTRNLVSLPTVYNGPRSTTRRGVGRLAVTSAVPIQNANVKDYLFAVIISPRSVSVFDILIS